MVSRQSQSVANSTHDVQPAKPNRSAPAQRSASNLKIGNQTAQWFLRDGVIQAKLTVNQPGDRFEQEADRMAEQVMRMPESGSQEVTQQPPGLRIQRLCSKCEEELHRKPVAEGAAVSERALIPRIQRTCSECKEELYRQEIEEEGTLRAKEVAGQTPEITSQVETQVNALQGSGQPLPESERAFFEPRFGYDFSRVRVHADAPAAEMARAVQAQAFTLGHSIVFGAGQYSPGTQRGRSLMAHELTHVLQQRSSTGVLHRQTALAEGEASAKTRPATKGKEEASRKFGVQKNDPPCPAPPTGLGDVLPDPPCQESTEIGVQGMHFPFCSDSDVFRSPNTPRFLAEFVRKQPAVTQFTVHGYSSTDGPEDYNMRLSCHRAKRVARELINAGVRSEQIEIMSHGETTEFSSGLEKPSRGGDRELLLALNRVAVVQVEAPPALELPSERLPADVLEDKRRIVQNAKDLLNAGTYPLEADAYISFWTCGHTPRVREAVNRMRIRIEGEPGVPKDPRKGVDRQGNSEAEGVNTIVLSNVAFKANNQLECVMNRIVDMSFHHMVMGQLGFPTIEQRHHAGMFLVHLAGFSACQLPPESLFGTSTSMSTPLTSDPRKDKPAPACLEPPLPGPLVRPAPGKTPTSIPQFDRESGMKGEPAGSLMWTLDSSPLINRGSTVTLESPITAKATVTLRGNPTEFPNYEVGYIQTITQDETTIDYVSGHRVRILLPVPIRDRDPESSTLLPWFSDKSVASPDATGVVQVDMSKPLVATEMPFGRKLDILGADGGKNIDVGNVIDTAERSIRFVTLLVARRRGAPLDRFSTHILDGTVFDFLQNVDVVGIEGEGVFSSKLSIGSRDDRMIQLGGPAADEIGLNEKTIIETEPPTREVAGKMDEREFANAVREIANTLTPKRLGLTHTTLRIQVRFNPQTGRVALGKKGDPPVVTARSPGVAAPCLEKLAREISFRIRKKNFLREPGKDVILKPELTKPLTPIQISPDPFKRLIDREGVRAKMKEIVAKTEKASAKNEPQGFAFLVVTDCQGGPIRKIDGTSKRCEKSETSCVCPESFDFSSLTVNDVVLGSIHTHPDCGPGFEESGPSGKDRSFARDETHGEQHFVILLGLETVLQFGPDKSDDKEADKQKDLFK
jgi:outer membrane protein OmpA-like peptidoglycan-associated protein